MVSTCLKKTGKIAALFVFLFVSYLYAGSIETKVSDANPGVNETIMLTVTAENADSIEPVKIPDAKDLEIQYAGTMNSFSWVNGKKSSSLIMQFQITPLKAGSVTIPPIPLILDGKNISTDPVKINVSGARSPRKRRSQGNNDPFANDPFFNDPFGSERDERADQRQAATLEGEVEYKNKTYYVGEAIPVKYNLIRSESVSVRDLRIQKIFKTDGFIKKDLKLESENKFKRGGETLIKNSFLAFVLTPASAGDFEVFGGNFLVSVERMTRGVFPASDTYSISYPTETLHVTELPKQGRPDDFSGTIGRFSIKSDNAKLSGKTFSEIKLSVSIEGEGNIFTLKDPVVKEINGLKILTEGNEPEFKIEGSTVTGKKTINYTIIPEKPGHYNLGAVTLNYFDPGSVSYKTVSTDEVTVDVTPGENDTTQNVFTGNAKSDYKFIGIIAASVIGVLLAAFFFVYLLLRERNKYKETIFVEKQAAVKPVVEKKQDDPKEFVRTVFNAWKTVDQNEIIKAHDSVMNYILANRTEKPDYSEKINAMKTALANARYGGGKIDISVLEIMRDELLKMLR
jgi:hypothetical protein